ncbi:MAG: PP2C family protein-serine/threonine phosphatase [Anaerolineae bacterium]
MNWMKRIRGWLVGESAEEQRTGEAPPDETLTLEASPSVQSAEAASLSESQERTSVSGVFHVGWITDVGRVRDHNEDGLFVFVAEQESADAVPPFGLFVLADGMGGHRAGEKASAVASRTVAAHLISRVYLSLLTGEERVATQPSFTEVMAEAVTAANRTVNRILPGSGTTLTCAMVVGSRLIIGHVGDSRAYLRSEGEAVRLLTNDHSMVNKLVEIGQLTKEEAAGHPQRNMLYRAVGQSAALDVDVISLSLRVHDRILLCSDGIWGLLSDDEIWQIITDASTPTEACYALADMANAAGGNDNLTAILVEIQRGFA